MKDTPARYYILDANHKPVQTDSVTCGRFLLTERNKIVKQEHIEGAYHGQPCRVEVSTVFLGLDHQYGEGPPILFETMLFCSTVPEVDQAMERCATWEEALAQHEWMKEQVRIKWTPNRRELRLGRKDGEE